MPESILSRRALVRIGLVATALVASLGIAQSLDSIPQGLQATYFSTIDWTSQPTLARIESQPSTTNLILAWDGHPPERFSVFWTGSLIVFQDATFNLGIRSSGGSWLYIADPLVIDNGGDHSARTVTASIKLRAGVHPIRIKYFRGADQLAFDLLWARGDRPLY